MEPYITITKDQYRSHPAISNSDLKLIFDPILFQANKQRQMEGVESTSSPAQRFGTIVDDFVFDNDNFDDKYILKQDIETPGSSQQQAFADEVLSALLGGNEANLPEIYARHYKNQDPTNEKTIAKAKELYDTLRSYIDFQLVSLNRQVITLDEYELVKKLGERIDGLIEWNFNHHGDMQMMTQYPIVVREPNGNFLIKGLLDILIVDHMTKTIYIVDLKTSSTALAYFVYDIRKYKYHYQLAHYRTLVKQLQASGWNSDYQISCSIIVAQTVFPNHVKEIIVPEHVLQEGETEMAKSYELYNYYRLNGWDELKGQTDQYIYEPDWNLAFTEEVGDVGTVPTE